MKDTKKANEVYVVTYENDGDEVELILATTDKDIAIKKAGEVGKEYDYGVMTTFRDNIKTATYWHDREDNSWNGNFEQQLDLV